MFCSMLVDGGAPDQIAGTVTVSCHLRSLPLLPRVYEVRAAVETKEAFEYFDWQPVATLRIGDTTRTALGPTSQSNLYLEGPIDVSHEWRIDPVL
jgi:hypothetical protein